MPTPQAIHASTTQKHESAGQTDTNVNFCDITEVTLTPDVNKVDVIDTYAGQSPFFEKSSDPRPHIKVLINDLEKVSLVDTGAVVCVLAVTGEAELIQYNGTLRSMNVFINTVHGHRTPALGVMNLKYEFGPQTAIVPTVVIKVHKLQIIVGMNFCRAFGVKLDIIPHCYVSTDKKTAFDATDIEHLPNKEITSAPSSGSGSPSPLTSVKNPLSKSVRHTTASLAEADVSFSDVTLISQNDSVNLSVSAFDTDITMATSSAMVE